MAGLRDHIFDELRPTFIKVFYGWAERDRLALADDPRLARDYVLMYSGAPGGGDWVRSDVVLSERSLEAAGQWGDDTWRVVTDRYSRVIPPIWWCGDTLRPTPFSDGTPAPSPLTAS